MVFRRFEDKQLQRAEFYKNIDEKSPGLIIILIIISLGLYIISWIYQQTKQLEKVDPDAPVASRSAFVLMIFPVGWYFINLVFKTLIFTEFTNSIFYRVFEAVVWLGLFLLVMKYLFDFGQSFGKITKTNGIIWFIFLSIGFLGLIGFGTGNRYLLVLVGILVITIPAMQAEMNKFCQEFKMRRYSNTYYDK